MAVENEAVDMFHVLPEGCVANVLSFTSPRDACRLSSLSTTFRSAAESDAVWDMFLPPQYRSMPSLSSESSQPCSSSKKELYLRLCDHPILVDEGRKSFWLEKRTGKICYMLSPKDLVIVWIETPRYWRWTALPEARNRFPEVAELICVCWLEIRGKISTSMLSPSTLYTAYLVFKVTSASYGLEDLPVEATVGFVGSEVQKRTVYLDAERGRSQRYQIVPWRIGTFNRTRLVGSQAPRPRENEEGKYPKERGDGWLEIELGEFFNGGGDGEVEMSVSEVEGGDWKGGLIVQGIEIRPKEREINN